LGDEGWIVAEEFFAVDKYFFYGLALGGDLAVPVDLDAGQFFEQVFHGGAGLGAEAVSVEFRCVSLDANRPFAAVDDDGLQQFALQHHGNGREGKDTAVRGVDLVHIIGIIGIGNEEQVVAFGNIVELEVTGAVAAGVPDEYGVGGSKQENGGVGQLLFFSRVGDSSRNMRVLRKGG
jgi:hypothetical protein